MSVSESRFAKFAEDSSPERRFTDSNSTTHSDVIWTITLREV
jgi:hypothetical protein